MRRLYISIILTVIGSLFIITWGLDKIVAKQEFSEDHNEYAIYHQLIEGFDRQLSVQRVDELSKYSHTLSEHYQVILTLDNAHNIALPQELATQLSQTGGLLLASESQPYLLKKITAHPDYILQLSLPAVPKEEQRFNMLLSASLYLGVCGIVIAWLFPLTRRLYVLTSTAAKIGEGELSARVPPSKFSYIRLLENSFNRMASQIEKLVADNKILARSMSHDIRTPMSCLRFGVEAAMDTQDIQKKNQYLERMETELTRMEDMTTAFLEYAGMERQGFQLKYEEINVEQLLCTLCNDFQSLAEQHNIGLDYQPSTMFTQHTKHLSLDYHWCYRAIQNLISNAVQYAQHQVIIQADCDQHHVYIMIKDDGKGIPEQSIKTIFDPFVKLDADRSREHGHFGLGLAITTKVVNWHRGRIVAKNNIDQTGACFTISLPLNAHAH